MRLENIYIESIGLYIPERLTLDDAVAAGHLTESELHQWDWTGVTIAGEIAPASMAVKAAENALTSSEFTSDDIGFLVHAGSSLQGQHGWPMHHFVQRHVARDDATAFRIDQACAGGLLGIQLAAAHLVADQAIDAAIVTGADNHFWLDRFEWVRLQRQSGGMGILKGDAAHAVTLARTGGIARILSISNIANADAEELVRLPGNQFPVPTRVPTPDEWRAIVSVDHSPGWVRTLGIKTARTAYAGVQQALSEADLTPSDIALFVPVLGPRSSLTEFICRRLPMPESTQLTSYGCSVGHLTVSDHAVALQWLIEHSAVSSGDRIVFCGNGQHTTIATMVVEIE